ncbi:hypothetical protein DNTS_018267, partial [Danionella cerebrum]
MFRQQWKNARLHWKDQRQLLTPSRKRYLLLIQAAVNTKKGTKTAADNKSEKAAVKGQQTTKEGTKTAADTKSEKGAAKKTDTLPTKHGIKTRYMNYGPCWQGK